MNNIYRIYASIEKNNEPDEFSTIFVCENITSAVSLFLDKFPTAEVMTIERVNYNGEKVFDDVYV